MMMRFTFCAVATLALSQFGCSSGMPSEGNDENVGQVEQAICTATFNSVSAGQFHSCYALSNGTVKCAGRNNYGQLGNGNTTNSNTWQTVSGINNASKVVSGTDWTCALLTTGAVKCWGNNANYILGATTPSYSTTPVTISGLTAIYLWGGSMNACAWGSGTNLKCWGNNYYGQVGAAGLGTNVATPTAVPATSPDNGFSACATQNGLVQASIPFYAICGYCERTVGMTTTSLQNCWGNNSNGAYGDGTTTNPTYGTARQISNTGMRGMSHVSAARSLWVSPSGYTQMTGTNANGQLGRNFSSAYETSLANLYNNQSFMGIFNSNGPHALAQQSASFRIYSWGSNANGQLGLGDTATHYSPQLIYYNGQPFVADGVIAGGGAHTIAARNSGQQLFAWGWNYFGQLGSGNNTEYHAPQLVANCP